MIISSTTDYRAAAQKRLPPFLFHYLDGGAYAEKTLARNVDDLADVALRQRVLDELRTTFASHYTREVSLAGALSPEAIAVYGKQATGETFLINPSLDATL